MPLLMTVDSLDNVPAALHTEYTEKDGKFHLNVEGLEDTGGLKSALETERTARKQLEKDVKAWKALGKTPAEIAELTSAAETAATEAAKKAGNFDAILGQHQKKWGEEKTTLVTERDGALNAARSAIVDAGILTALSQNKATSEGAAILPRLLGDRVRTEFVNGKFVPSIVQPDGETPMIGSGPGGAATYDDLVKEAVKNFPSLFEGTGAGGGGKPPKDGGGSASAIMTSAAFAALDAKGKAAAAAKPGFKLVD